MSAVRAWQQAAAAVFTAAAAAGACGQKPAADANKAAPAAVVQNARPESDLATITLSADAEKHLALQTTEVSLKSIAGTRVVGGIAIVAPGRAIVISAPVSGTLIASANGAPAIGPVAKDAVVFELLPVQPADRDALASAERDLQEAEARVTEFDQRLRRLEGLLREGSASQKSVEEARADRAVAAAAATAAGRKLAALRRVPAGRNGGLALTAPFAGVLTAIRAASGQTVAAGAPIAEMAQVDRLWIQVPLFAGDAAGIDRSRPASIAALGREATGPWRDVRRVAGPPSADPGAASVDLFFELAPAGGIRPGERVAVTLPLKSATPERALVIPASAIVYDLNGGTWVYESKDQHVFVRRRVELAGSSGSSVVVRRGLSEGLRIVSVGAAELYGTEFYVSK